MLPKRSVAPRGSILKVWKGHVEYMRKTAGFNCTMMSTKDIKLFQSLHKWPKTLQLAGRAKLDDAV